MVHLSRTELRKGKLTKEEIKKIIKEDRRPKQLDLFSHDPLKNVKRT